MIVDAIQEFFYKVIISFIGLIYGLVSYVYEVFLCLAQKNIFDQDIYHNIADKIYVILGVVMLFVIAYNLLTLVIDPDKNSKGQSIEKLLKNLVTSVILVIICPSLFNFAFRLQNSILLTNGGVINNLFADDVQDRSGEDSIKMGGKIFALDVFKAFFTPEDNNYSLQNKSTGKDYTLEDGTKISCKGKNSCSLTDAEKVAYDSGSFTPYKAFAMNIAKDEIDFNWILSLIAGGYLVYVIVSFCFDLAVRACKLALYQILAPICITCRALPKSENIFSNWLKAVKNTFLSVFVRIFIMNLGVLIVVAFRRSDFWDACEGCSPLVPTIGNAFIILGILTFINQAPKLVDQIFNFGDVKLGIKDKFNEATSGVVSLGARIGSTVGGGATSGVNSLMSAIKNFQTRNAEINSQGVDAWTKNKAKLQNIAHGAGSVLASTVTGAVRGAKAGAGAKNFKDMKAAAGRAAEETAAARGRRQDRKDRYQATANTGNIIKDIKTNVSKTFRGHLQDTEANIVDWATGGANAYEGVIKVADQFKQAQDKIHAEAEKLIEKNKANAAFVSDMWDSVKQETRFKGKDKDKLYDLLTNEYGGMSMAAIEADINRREQFTDFGSMVDKEAFRDATTGKINQDKFNEAVDKIAREYANDVALRKNMFAQMQKRSIIELEEVALQTMLHRDRAANASWWSQQTELQQKLSDLGVKDKDFEAIFANEEEFRVLHESHGGKYTDAETGKIVFVNADSAEHIDDIASARKVEGDRARSASARQRQEAEIRKSQSGNGNGH